VREKEGSEEEKMRKEKLRRIQGRTEEKGDEVRGWNM
jgi:hypothetical protein